MAQAMTQAKPLAYLKVMLQARLKAWEASLATWEELNSTGLHTEHVIDRKARLEELREVMRLVDDL